MRRRKNKSEKINDYRYKNKAIALDFLPKEYRVKKKEHFNFNQAGTSKDLKNKYSLVELQHRVLVLRGNNE